MFMIFIYINLKFLSLENALSKRKLRNLVEQNNHFGGGDSYFDELSRNHLHTRQGSFQQQVHTGRNCKTVTKKVGNTISTYTTCT